MFVWCLSATQLSFTVHIFHFLENIFFVCVKQLHGHLFLLLGCVWFEAFRVLRFVWFFFSFLTVVFLNSNQRNRHSLNMATNKSHRRQFSPFILLILLYQFSLKQTVSSFPHSKPCERRMRILNCVKQSELILQGYGPTRSGFEIVCHFLLLGNQQPRWWQTWRIIRLDRTLHSAVVQWRWLV